MCHIDFGKGPVPADLLPWGDVFTAFYSTGIPNIKDYAAFPNAQRQLMSVLNALRPIFKLGFVRRLLKRGIQPGPTADARARTFTHVWGEVRDDRGRTAVSRLHGPEAGVIWTGRAALAIVRQVMIGNAPPGFQTPARAFGADLVMECEGVTRQDLDA